ncbi:MAG: methionine synthase [Planctomycetota bacterium]|jgi:5-methyltetrahydrofolate--homocysteine methyltransferase
MTRIAEELSHRILCLDGAMGTAIQARDLAAADFGGEHFDGCNEQLNLTRPDVIEAIHREHLEAGADILETNTFGSTSLVLAEYPPLHEQAHAITLAAAKIARAVADTVSTEDRPRFVAGSMGPTTKAISVTGGVTFEALRETFGDQAQALVEGGVDYLLIETAQDTRNIKAALLGCHAAFERAGRRVPIAVSGTIEAMGTMLAGQTADALAVSVMHEDLLYLGLNCATGPDFMTDHLRAISELAKTRTAVVPNAGLPDEDGNYLETPEMITTVMERFVNHGWLNLVGGCCGTTPAHIRSLAQMVRGKQPRVLPAYRRTLFSGMETVAVEEDTRPLLVGERTNVLGSRRFKRLIAEGKFEEAGEIARKQARRGAQVIDVCLQDPDRDEVADMHAFLDQVVRKVKAPLMIDTTDAEVTELALTYCQGKAIINSVNLEDGLERFDQVVPLARRFGAALVVGCIDEDKEQGMAVTRERKLAVAQRSHDILVCDYDLDPCDLIFDPLVFPCATGDANYVGSARETVEGIRLIKEHLPDCKTILGISNVSFGLPGAGREVLNSVFLHDCTQAGLDLAIVNTERLERYAEIPEEERRLAERVLYDTTDESIAEFADHYRDATSRSVADTSNLSLDERIAHCIVGGTKEGLREDLDTKLAEARPLDIINGPLMAGMDEVGRLFNANELIVAEVLQSAEAMKAAVTYLEPHMEKSDSALRGTVILATVKGDVHDIGKNLVDIILSNNGYRVVNLGIKVAPHEIIGAIREHKPDVLGLSGLLVKSAQQMVVTAEELSDHKECPPLLVGGAALSRNFTYNRIAPQYEGITIYAKDAMHGLDLANRLRDETERKALLAEVDVEREQVRRRQRARAAQAPAAAAAQPVPRAPDLPTPPDLKRHVMQELPLGEVWRFVNPTMLYGKHLGLHGGFEKLIAEGDAKAIELQEVVRELQKGPHALHARAVWQWQPVRRDGESIEIDGHRIRFPRQAGGRGLCLADYVAADDEGKDHVALFVVTAGDGVREAAERLKNAGEFLKSHALAALALETAEAAAEWLHAKLRAQWGFPDAADMTMKERFGARYRGKRYSFGYPACPDLANQRMLFDILRPEEIGVTLTEGDMMDPEASVSALVFHHPEAAYFSVSS